MSDSSSHIPPATPVQKRRAQDAVKREVNHGRLTPAKNCESCDAPPPSGERLVGHHAWGYAPENMLRVQWLCRPCHGLVHGGYVAAVAARRTHKTEEQLRQESRDRQRRYLERRAAGLTTPRTETARKAQEAGLAVRRARKAAREADSNDD